MMRPTNFLATLIIGVSGICSASTDPECLKHLGGAFAGVECFNGLSTDLKQQNVKLAKELAANIPDQNKNKLLLTTYLHNQAEAQRYCELARQSMTGWLQEPAAINPRYHDYDVAYYECVYGVLEQENKFLKSLLKNARQN